MSKKPAVVHFTDESSLAVDHVDAHDGYLYAQRDGTAFYWPWHRVEAVHRDLSDDAAGAVSGGREGAMSVVSGP